MNTTVHEINVSSVETRYYCTYGIDASGSVEKYSITKPLEHARSDPQGVLVRGMKLVWT